MPRDARLEVLPGAPRDIPLERGDLVVLLDIDREMMRDHDPTGCNGHALMHERRGALAHASFVASKPQPWRSRYSSRTETTFVSDAAAPAASVTVTRTVNERGRTIT